MRYSRYKPWLCSPLQSWPVRTVPTGSNDLVGAGSIEKTKEASCSSLRTKGKGGEVRLEGWRKTIENGFTVRYPGFGLGFYFFICWHNLSDE
jgi:hypothetical protein